MAKPKVDMTLHLHVFQQKASSPFGPCLFLHLFFFPLKFFSNCLKTDRSIFFLFFFFFLSWDCTVNLYVITFIAYEREKKLCLRLKIRNAVISTLPFVWTVFWTFSSWTILKLLWSGCFHTDMKHRRFDRTTALVCKTHPFSQCNLRQGLCGGTCSSVNDLAQGDFFELNPKLEFNPHFSPAVSLWSQFL